MNVSSINPYIRIATPSVLSVGSEIKNRIIFDYELIYIEDGTLYLVYDGKEYCCRKGQFVFLRPGITHAFRKIDAPLSQPHIHFDMVYQTNSEEVPVSFKDEPHLTEQEKQFIRCDIFRTYPQNPLVHFNNHEETVAIFHTITSKSDRSPLAKKALLIQLIDRLIANNFPDVFQKKDFSYAVERQVKDFIDAQQAWTLSLDDLEKQFNYNKFYLEKRFQKTYGTSLIKYCNHHRLQKAKELLQTESVSAVAEKLGYSSVFTFSRAFKQYFGINPSKVQKAR